MTLFAAVGLAGCGPREDDVYIARLVEPTS